MQSKKEWSVSTANILMGLGIQQTHHGIELGDLKYSILDPKVAYRSSQELAAIYTALPQGQKAPPKELVAFRPERIALHEAIVAVSTRVQVKDEEDMRRKVNLVCGVFSEDIASKAEELDRLRVRIERDMRSDLIGIKAGEYANADLRGPIKLLNETYKRIQAANPDANVDNAVIAMVTDKLYTEEATKQMSKLINQGVTSLIEQDELSEINIPASDKRQTFMVAGGQASGKGSSVAQLQYAASQQGIDWDNVAKINTDSYKALIIEPGTVNPELYSQLAQEEASLVHQKVQKQLTSLAEQGKSPHVFVDQVFLGKDKLDFALLNGGGAKVMVVSTEVTDAVERSYARGESDGPLGRYEDTQGILRCHKAMTEQVPKTLADFIGKNVEVQVVDNNVVKGSQPVPIMHVDLAKGVATVQDEDKVKRFLQKTTININATSDEEAYTDAPATKTSDYLKPLSDGGVVIKRPEIVAIVNSIVDQAVDPSNSSHL